MSGDRLRPHRRIVFLYHYARNKKLMHVLVVMKDVPGALAGVLEVLRGRVNLIGTTSYNIEKGLAIFSGFSEALPTSGTAKEIEKAISKSPKVVEVQVEASKDGLLTDSFHNGLQLGIGDSEIMLNSAALSDMFGQLISVFGTGGETILFNSGENYGTVRGHAFRKMLGPEVMKRNLNQLARNFASFGWGTAKFKSGPPGLMKIRITECFECLAKVDPRRSCSFMRGFITGFFTQVFGEGLSVKEILCIANGANDCEFVLTK